MGKLVERFQDAARSDVYRVGAAAIPLQAAAEADARVLELDAHEARSLAARLQQLTAEGDRRPCVVLIGEGGQPDAALLDQLHALARQCREDGLAFFVLIVDPAGMLDLPPLYKERS